MKLGKTPTDGKLHAYCIRCRRETIRERSDRGRPAYHCLNCNAVSPRALIIDPAISWWLGDDGEYWHETAGTFVRNLRDEFLFFERVKYPFGLTIPAGHVDRSESPVDAARRELFEEAGFGLPLRAFKLVVFEKMLGDECYRGSDAHRWNAYVARMRSNATVKVNTRESVRPRWLTLEQALRSNPTFALRSLITRHAGNILRGQL